MEIKIICNCSSCDGYGFIALPVNIVCHECDGVGKKTFVEVCGSITDAQDNYPEAVGFTYL
tara:strand:+ start:344 stop:526 length:183 start_codon:yes stop_codon:yes gene_type:complete